jgi:dipeptidyl aminopeptidase/acylaminoacyl peptidase
MRLFSAFVFTMAAFAASPDSHKLTLEDLLSAEAIGDATLSPDGKTFAIARGGQIDLLPSEGGWPVTLTSAAGGKSGLNWSPDSRYIAYASQGSIWAVPVDGGQPKRLTHAYPAAEGDPRQASDRNPQWSPKGRWILFQTGRRGHEDLVVVSDDGRTEYFLTQGDGEAGSASWAPDGSHISYTERKPQYFSGKLEVVKFDPRTGQGDDPATVYTSPTDRGGGWSVGKASWSPDSKTLAVALQDSGWDKIYLIPAAGGTPKQLTQGEFEDLNPVYAPNGKSIAITSNRKLKEESNVWIVPVDGSAAKQLTRFSTPGVEASAEWSPDGSRVFFRRSSPVESSDLVVADATGSTAPKYLTHTLPKNLESAFRAPEKITWHSKDGLEVSGILYKPENLKPGVLAPAVLWIHGGPEAEDVFRLDPWAQYLAQQGYLVLEPNYRGSTGYGEKFRNLNVEDSGGGEAADVAAGAQYLVDQKLADPKRLAVGGGSHGGTMVAYMVTKYPALFHAAIEMYGVVDRAVFNERTNLNSAVRWQMKMGGSPVEKPEVYKKANILLDVDKITTPLLILHGENDPQVPPIESAMFVKALREHRKVFYYYTYPNELHGFSQRDHRLDAWNKELTFLAKYLQPAFGASSTSTDELLLKAQPAGPGRGAAAAGAERP